MQELAVQELEDFKRDVLNVAVARDLQTATDYGLRMNRLLSGFDRQSDRLTTAQKTLLTEAHNHVVEMMNCPRRMRLDTTWPNDFVIAARQAADALIAIAKGQSDDPL